MTSVGVVVTAHDQQDVVPEAVASVLAQTLAPDRIVVVDDGSAKPLRLPEFPSVHVLRQGNAGVAAARNAGLSALDTELAAVLDGDDRWAPTFLERTSQLLGRDGDAVAASSSMRMFGVATARVDPTGGGAADFLARNNAPSSLLMRRDAWQAAGGYDEDMRQGFEDWDFALRLLTRGGRIAIVDEPLIEYRTAPASANLASMDHRLELYARIIDRHRPLFERHLDRVLLDLEATSIARLTAWEELAAAHPTDVPLDTATYGDGGMAAVVRLASARLR